MNQKLKLENDIEAILNDYDNLFIDKNETIVKLCEYVVERAEMAVKNSNRFEQQVIKKNADIEFRPNLEDIDEIVCHNLKFLHLEYMDDNSIWMNIENEDEQYHVHIHPRNNKSRFHIITHAERLK
jgi:hypothetical protein